MRRPVTERDALSSQKAHSKCKEGAVTVRVCVKTQGTEPRA